MILGPSCFFSTLVTGLLLYRYVAKKINKILPTVPALIGVPNITLANIAVNTISSAEAKFFSIELRQRRKKLTTMPIHVELNMMKRTLACRTGPRFSEVRKVVSCPFQKSRRRLQQILEGYKGVKGSVKVQTFRTLENQLSSRTTILLFICGCTVFVCL